MLESRGSNLKLTLAAILNMWALEIDANVRHDFNVLQVLKGVTNSKTRNKNIIPCLKILTDALKVLLKSLSDELFQ